MPTLNNNYIRRTRNALVTTALAGLLIAPAAGAHDIHDPTGAELNAPKGQHFEYPKQRTFDARPLPTPQRRRGATAAGAKKSQSPVGGLPRSWCGSERFDESPQSTFDASKPQIKVIYARPAGAPNRFREFADLMQADISLIEQKLAQESGGRKALRFDLGTDCGPGYLDIRSVVMNQPKENYLLDLGFNFSRVKEELRGLIQSVGGRRNAFVVMDGLYENQTWAPTYSTGELRLNSDLAGPNAPNNLGGLLAFHWLRSDYSPGYNPDGFDPSATLHEIAHGLGAVSLTAPHSTLAGHCNDGADLMCYEDGGLRQQQSASCPRGDGIFPEQFDCNKDDYFSPTPNPGSYLAQKFNLFDSPFMADCSELGVACGDANPQALGELRKQAATKVRRANRSQGSAKMSATYKGSGIWRIEGTLSPSRKASNAKLCVDFPGRKSVCAKKSKPKKALRVKLNVEARTQPRQAWLRASVKQAKTAKSKPVGLTLP